MTMPVTPSSTGTHARSGTTQRRQRRPGRSEQGSRALKPELYRDPELRALVPPPTPEEVEQLRANLKADGCREPLVIWPTSAGPILLDGHNRYEICQQQNIHFDTVEIELASREEAATWIINNQLGRRNLT